MCDIKGQHSLVTAILAVPIAIVKWKLQIIKQVLLAISCQLLHVIWNEKTWTSLDKAAYGHVQPVDAWQKAWLRMTQQQQQEEKDGEDQLGTGG